MRPQTSDPLTKFGFPFGKGCVHTVRIYMLEDLELLLQHCKLFNHRPFIGHIWDDLRDGFSFLVNYHKLDYKNLETLISTYIGDWISQQKRDITLGWMGNKRNLMLPKSSRNCLNLSLRERIKYNIFVMWKPLAEQPIRWDPDLNDKVRLNIRLSLTVQPNEERSRSPSRLTEHQMGE